MNKRWVINLWNEYINGYPFNEFLFDSFITIITGIICGLISAGLVVFILNHDLLSSFIILCIGLVCLFFAVALIIVSAFHKKKLSIEKLKINGTIIIAMINYILLSQDRNMKKKDLNEIYLQKLNVELTLDEIVSGTETFKETYAYSLVGVNHSKESISNMIIYLVSPITEREFLSPNAKYKFERDSHSVEIKPDIVDKPVYAQINLDLTMDRKLCPIAPNDSLNCRFIRERINKTADMSNFLYVVDPYNFATKIRELHLRICCYDALYRDTTVEIYEFNRENIIHKQIAVGSFTHNKTDKSYDYNFDRYETDLMINKLYGIMIVKK